MIWNREIKPVGMGDISRQGKTPRVLNLKRIKHEFFFAILAEAIILAIIFGLIFHSANIKAEVAYFYPSTVLGNWLNSSFASGQPDLNQEADISDFNGQNSAIFDSGRKQIFFSGFQGDLPAGSSLSSARLSLSWAINSKQDAFYQGLPPKPAEEINAPLEIIENPADQTEILGESTSTIDVILSPSETQTEEGQPAVPPSGENSESQTLLESLISSAWAQETPLAENPAQGQAETTADSSANEPAMEWPTNAESQVSEPPIVGQKNSDAPNGELPVSDSPASNPPVGDAMPSPPAPANETLNENQSEAETNAAASISDVLSGDGSNGGEKLFIIKYSIDGSAWQELAQIEAQNFSRELDLPLTSINDLSKLQISIETLPSAEQSQNLIVFLDGLYLEINYQPPEEEPQPEPEEQKDQENQLEKPPVEDLSVETQAIEFQDPAKSFEADQEPEFVLPKIEKEGLIEKLKSLFNSGLTLQDAVLIGPDKIEMPADVAILQGETNNVIIRKRAGWQPGVYQFRLNFRMGGVPYLASVNFEWKAPPPKKVLSFFLSGAPIQTRRSLTQKNSSINIAVGSDKKEPSLIFSGQCASDYFTILMYEKSGDYESNPSSFLYNKAFPCQNGSYRYELKDLPASFKPGVYYFLVNDQNKNGVWQPATAMQPVLINLIEVASY